MEDQHPDQRAQQTDLALQWVTHMEITIYGICSVAQLQKKAVRIAFLGARARMTLQLRCHSLNNPTSSILNIVRVLLPFYQSPHV
jgi:hypothetical protein